MRASRIVRALLTFNLCTGVVAFAAAGANAQEQIYNGDMEYILPLPSWTLEETITGMPGAEINSADINKSWNYPSNQTDTNGIRLRAYQGNLSPYSGQNKMINAILSQVVPAVAGDTYTFSGWSLFGPNYAGAVDFLDPTSPSGAVESPTNTTFEMSFLNSSDSVVGSPVTLDLRTVQFGDGNWRQGSLMGVAPAGTAKVRVAAAGSDMVFNVDPSQTAYVDEFSLTAASAPGTELLANANLNLPAEVPGDGYTITQSPANPGNMIFQSASFANHTPGGNVGVYVKGFLGGDATVSQLLPAAEGDDYTFSAWTFWSANYCGGRAETVGSTNTLLELAFLDGGESVIGTPVTLDLRTEQMNDATWRQHALNGIAPAGTASVRVSGIATGMLVETGPSLSAFFDDFSLVLNSGGGLAGDYNGNDIIDAADYTVWRDALTAGATDLLNDSTPGTVDESDFTYWRDHFGQTAGSGAGSNSAAVPEPGSFALLAIACAGVALALRRRVL